MNRHPPNGIADPPTDPNRSDCDSFHRCPNTAMAAAIAAWVEIVRTPTARVDRHTIANLLGDKAFASDLPKSFLRDAKKTTIPPSVGRQAIRQVMDKVYARVREDTAVGLHVYPPYLWRAAKHEVATILRAGPKLTFVSFDPGDFAAQERPRRHRPEEVYRAMRDAVAEALVAIPAEDCAVLTLYYIDNRTQAEIAAHLASLTKTKTLSQATISRHRLPRAHQRLRDAVKAILAREGIDLDDFSA